MTEKELVKAILSWAKTVELDRSDRNVIGKMINLIEEFQD